MLTLNNEFLIKHKKKIILIALILLSPIILSVLNISIDFVYNIGRIVGTNLRNISEVVCNMLQT